MMLLHVVSWSGKLVVDRSQFDSQTASYILFRAALSGAGDLAASLTSSLPKKSLQSLLVGPSRCKYVALAVVY